MAMLTSQVPTTYNFLQVLLDCIKQLVLKLNADGHFKTGLCLNATNLGSHRKACPYAIIVSRYLNLYINLFIRTSRLFEKLSIKGILKK